MRFDQRKTPAEENYDRRLHAGERLRQDDMAGQRHAIFAIRAVEPMNPPKISRVRFVRADRFEARFDGSRHAQRIGELTPGGQIHLRDTHRLDGGAAPRGVDDLRPHQEWFRHEAKAAA